MNVLKKTVHPAIAPALVYGAFLSTLMLSACASEKPVKATLNPDGTQSVRVLVKQGYHPSVIEAKAGVPLKMEFYRDEPAGHSCDDHLTIKGENIENVPLPAKKSKWITVAPRKSGRELKFECGMEMMSGKILYR